MNPEPGLMPIGRLARLSRLTVKALRLYDTDGLLPPAWVDPATGYRYYRPEHVRTATSIALLRSLDVPLATVRAVLDAPDEAARAEVLEGERSRAEEEVRARQQALRSIARLAADPGALRYDVRIGDEPARPLAALSGTVVSDRLGPDVGALCARATDLLGALGTQPLVALYPLDLGEAIDVTVGAPADTVPPGLHAAELSAGAWAGTIHIGPYDELPLAYAALLEHVSEHRYDPIDPIVETYLEDPRFTAPDQLVTRIAVRVC